MKFPTDVYEVWFSISEADTPLVAMFAADSHGQKRLVATSTFGPFDDEADVCAWVYERLMVDSGQAPVLHR